MLTISSARRAVPLAATAVATAALLVACGSAAAPHSAAMPGGTVSGRQTQSAGAERPGPSASSSAAGSGSAGMAGLTACRSASLRVTVNARQAGGAAGSTYYPVDFTNISRSACGLYGYPGISFVTSGASAGRQIGAAAQRNPAFGKLAVRLAAGGVAHAWLQVAQAGNYPASSCDPVKAHWLRVFAPGQTVPSFVNYSFDAYASARAPLLTVMPVRVGRGVQGKTP